MNRFTVNKGGIYHDTLLGHKPGLVNGRSAMERCGSCCDKHARHGRRAVISMDWIMITVCILTE